MLDRITRGVLPAKPHTALRGPGGELRYEECLTRAGFDGPFTILYHEYRPHALEPVDTRRGWALPEPAREKRLARRHYRTTELERSGRDVLSDRVPLLFNQDVVISALKPGKSDSVYWSNADADELLFIHEGGGLLRTPLGDLRFRAGDYLCVPRGIQRRFLVDDASDQSWLCLEFSGPLGLLGQWRNEVGQLRMDAPYSHRDFRRPDLEPRDEKIRDIMVKRNGRFHGYRSEHSPLDVVGWDGTVYPWAFPIRNFQPKVGAVHLPPTVHGTFSARGALVCSFVPRPLDFHPDAVPCPYPHSSVDVDEIIFYVSGRFTSRRGVDEASLTHHPAGTPHGPHPGAYEGSLGTERTEELAVMLDCYRPLVPTAAAEGIEDASYDESFL